MNKFLKKSNQSSLREKAEDLMMEKVSKLAARHTEADLLKLVHELEIHKIELELQNEELIKARIAAVKASERYLELYDFAPSGYFTLSREGKIIEMNLNGSSLLGNDRKHIQNSYFDSFITPDSKPVFIDFLKRVFKSKSRMSAEVSLSNNAKLPAFIYLTGIATEDNKQCLVTAVEITERKRTEIVHKILYNIAMAVIASDSIEQIIDVSRQELNQLFDTRNLIVSLYDKKTNTLRKIDMQDDKSITAKCNVDQSLSGIVVKEGKTVLLNRDEIIKIASHQSITPQDSKASCWLGVPLTINKDIIGAIVIQSNNNPYAYDKKSAALLEIVAQDLSIFIEKTRILENLKTAKEKAEESDRLKTSFLANMSHEIRTPMSGILGFAELLKEPNLKSEVQKEYIDVIEKSGQRMLNLINDIVDISKIEAGLMETQVTECNINSEIDYLLAFFGPQAANQKIKLVAGKGLPDEKARIKTDHEKVVAVITNLVKNAINYSHADKIEIRYLVKGKMLRFFVKDNGEGIPDCQQKAIFERFVQGDFKNKKNIEGSGLGLTISKAYVAMLKGKMWLDSTPGKGATFYFTIPYSPLRSNKNST